MNSTRHLATAVALVAAFGLTVGTACGDDDTAGQEEEVCERPQEAEEIVGDEIIVHLEEEGEVPFHCGDSPPDLEGSYEFFDREVYFNDSENWPSTGNFCDQIQIYQATDTPERYEFSTESPDCDSSGEALDSYVTGEDDCFTVFAHSETVFNGCERERARMMSACVDEDGDLYDAVASGYTLATEDTPECEDVIEDGRITAEGEFSALVPSDGKAPRVGE